MCSWRGIPKCCNFRFYTFEALIVLFLLHSQHSNRLCAYLKGCGGINAFVLVRNGANVRFDQAFQNMLKQYHEMFGQKFFERLIIVATRIEYVTKTQYEQNNQEKVLREDICNLFNLRDSGDSGDSHWI